MAENRKLEEIKIYKKTQSNFLKSANPLRKDLKHGRLS